MSEVPTIDVPARNETLLAALERLRVGTLRHPIAARAIFAALVEEGRRYSTTPHGKQNAESLTRSAAFARARHTWSATTAWLTEGADTDVALPSTLVDSLLAVAASDDNAVLLERLSAGRTRR